VCPLPFRWRFRHLEKTFAAVAKILEKAIAPDLENENQNPGQNDLKWGDTNGGDAMK
jgi:hypothetical protein